jgi:hypothetical protein
VRVLVPRAWCVARRSRYRNDDECAFWSLARGAWRAAAGTGTTRQHQ